MGMRLSTGVLVLEIFGALRWGRGSAVRRTCFIGCGQKLNEFDGASIGRLPGEKLHSLDSAQDALLLLRAVGTVRQKSIHMRDHRPHLLAEAVSFELDSGDVSSRFLGEIPASATK